MLFDMVLRNIKFSVTKENILLQGSPSQIFFFQGLVLFYLKKIGNHYVFSFTISFKHTISERGKTLYLGFYMYRTWIVLKFSSLYVED